MVHSAPPAGKGGGNGLRVHEKQLLNVLIRLFPTKPYSEFAAETITTVLLALVDVSVSIFLYFYPSMYLSIAIYLSIAVYLSFCSSIDPSIHPSTSMQRPRINPRRTCWQRRREQGESQSQTVYNTKGTRAHAQSGLICGGLVERVRIRRHCGLLCSKLVAAVSGRICIAVVVSVSVGVVVLSG